MLVEIILGKETGDRALAAALDYVRAIRKTPIVVNDARGFFANRCVAAYMLEGHLMVMEGVPPAMIENVGPDGRHAGRAAVPQRRGRARPRAQDRQGDQGSGRAGGRGPEPGAASASRWSRREAASAARTARAFTTIPRAGRSGCGRALTELQPTHLDPDTISVEELKQRFLVAQALEAARTVEEGVVTDPREADVGSILGFGFAPFTGGALSYIDFMGARRFVELCRRLEAEHGSRFAPPKILLDMAERGGTFYGRAAGKKAA